MKNIDFLLKIFGQLSPTEQISLYLLMQDKYRCGIPLPKPGESFNRARCPTLLSSPNCPVLTPQFIAFLSLALAACRAAYNIFFVPSHAERADVETRLHKLEVNDANHAVREQGFQGALETLADTLSRRC
jgi:hypothetical protein